VSETPTDGFVEVERTARDTIPSPKDEGRPALGRPSSRQRRDLAMRGIETFFATPFEGRMAGDERAILEDTDGISKHVNVENPTPRRIRHAVEIAADADHAFMRHAAFETKRRLVGRKRQGLQRILFFCEGFVDDPPGRRMHARVGDRVEPMPELGVQILEVAERAAEEEVLADISERPLDFSLRFGSVWSAGARLEPIMPGQRGCRRRARRGVSGILCAGP